MASTSSLVVLVPLTVMLAISTCAPSTSTLTRASFLKVDTTVVSTAMLELYSKFVVAWFRRRCRLDNSISCTTTPFSSVAFVMATLVMFVPAGSPSMRVFRVDSSRELSSTLFWTFGMLARSRLFMTRLDTMVDSTVTLDVTVVVTTAMVSVAGSNDGRVEGTPVGDSLGEPLGPSDVDGAPEGVPLGTSEGASDGRREGTSDGK